MQTNYILLHGVIPAFIGGLTTAAALWRIRNETGEARKVSAGLALSGKTMLLGIILDLMEQSKNIDTLHVHLNMLLNTLR